MLTYIMCVFFCDRRAVYRSKRWWHCCQLCHEFHMCM